MRLTTWPVLMAAGACFFSGSILLPEAAAQTNPIPERELALVADSGWVQNHGQQRAVIYSKTIRVPDAPWIRLKFTQAILGEAPAGGQPTILRITSEKDRAYQTLNALHLEQWNNSTAYFNGNAVRLEILAEPGAQPSRVIVGSTWVGDIAAEPESICGPTDDRVLSNEPGNARLMSVGCTAWIISDAANCLLTAGHCTITASSVVQFNVPLSNSNGTVNHPPPQHQYAVDLASRQTGGSGGVGNDWMYFGCFPNSNTGLTPFQAQQHSYNLATAAPPVSGQQIRITGYGTVSSPVSPTWNQVQKTHSGPYFQMTGTTVRYQTDTTGGNSGSPVFDLSTNLAIGIHTHGGCTSTGGSNAGTAIHHSALQNALANPTGVCLPPPPQNNTCINATAVGPGTHSFTTFNATTTGPDEPGCTFNGYSQIGRDVWFKAAATCTGTMTVALCGSAFNTKMAAYAACPTASGQTLACNDDFCGVHSQISFPVVAGQIYTLRIGGFQNATGVGVMTITCAASCLGDINGDGVVNVNDLLAVINAWGPCPAPPASCQPDIVPPGGDGIVNVNDLLACINNWGPCP